MTMHLVQCFVISSLRRYPPSALMHRSGMGAHRSLGFVAGGNYYEEGEEGGWACVLTQFFHTLGSDSPIHR